MQSHQNNFYLTWRWSWNSTSVHRSEVLGAAVLARGCGCVPLLESQRSAYMPSSFRSSTSWGHPKMRPPKMQHSISPTQKRKMRLLSVMLREPGSYVILLSKISSDCEINICHLFWKEIICNSIKSCLDIIYWHFYVSNKRT